LVGSAGRLTLAHLRERCNEILSIAERHGARNVRVFGSVARGEARSDSDVDPLVELDSERNVLDLSELILDLQNMLGCSVDVVESQHRAPAVKRLERDAIVL
jgi:predicted nucleotidyltransferase